MCEVEKGEKIEMVIKSQSVLNVNIFLMASSDYLFLLLTKSV